MNSSPASKAVRLASCRRIEHLHLADADLGIDRDVGDALAGRRKRGVTIDAHPTVVLVEEPHLTHAGVPVQLDDDVAGMRTNRCPRPTVAFTCLVVPRSKVTCVRSRRN